MTLDDLIKNMNPQMLSNAISQMGNMLSPEQMRKVQQTIQNTDKGELNQKLNHLSTADLQKELRQNPALAKQLANNPELMQKINQIFNKK